jgi:hypothetical protein
MWRWLRTTRAFLFSALGDVPETSGLEVFGKTWTRRWVAGGAGMPLHLMLWRAAAGQGDSAWAVGHRVIVQWPLAFESGKCLERSRPTNVRFETTGWTAPYGVPVTHRLIAVGRTCE